jgi:hypothetical protein
MVTAMQVLQSGQQLAMVSVVALLLNGCQPADNRPFTVYPVDGQLIFQNKPAAGAEVTFVPDEANPTVFSLTCTVDSKGHFVPKQADGAIGLPVGTYRLTVVWPLDNQDRFAGKYASPETPLTTVEIGTTVNILPPIRIK